MSWVNIVGWEIFIWASLSVIANVVIACIRRDGINFIPQLIMYLTALILIGR